jgi:hypothetical protein
MNTIGLKPVMRIETWGSLELCLTASQCRAIKPNEIRRVRCVELQFGHQKLALGAEKTLASCKLYIKSFLRIKGMIDR